MDTFNTITLVALAVILPNQFHNVNSRHVSIDDELLNLRYNNAFETEAITPEKYNLENDLGKLSMRTLLDNEKPVRRVKRDDADKEKAAPEDASVNSKSDASKSDASVPSSIVSTNSSTSVTSTNSTSVVNNADVNADANSKAESKNDPPASTQASAGSNSPASSDTSKPGLLALLHLNDPALQSAGHTIEQGAENTAKQLHEQKVNKLKEALTGVLNLGTGVMKAAQSSLADNSFF